MASEQKPKTVKLHTHLVMTRRGVARAVKAVPHVKAGEFAVLVMLEVPEVVFQSLPTPSVSIQVPVEHVRFPRIDVATEPVPALPQEDVTDAK